MSHNTHLPDYRGYTMIELIVTVAIMGIISSIAIPVFSSWLPDYRLKSAIRDLYSNMQMAKLRAVTDSDNYRIIFNTGNGGSYRIVRSDGTTERTVTLCSYDPSGNITFGGGKATKAARASGGAIPADGVSYAYNRISFNPTGMANSMGYVYLANERGAVYAVGTWISGIIVLRKWNEITGEWE